jgi:hypothetical protein
VRRCEMSSEAAERYVAGTMDESERTGFEDHFFACDDCFRTVEALDEARRLVGVPGQTVPVREAVRGIGAPSYLPLRWLAAAATVIFAVAIWQTTRPDLPTSSATPPAEAVTPSASATAAPPQPAAVAPAAPVVSPRPPTSSHQDRLARWAAVAPPQYLALPTRAERDTDAQAFEAAMAHYSAGRHRQAADHLQPLAERSPDAAHVHFFLGISHLMTGDVTQARGALQRTAAIGVTPYSDEAHFYLAKAALRAGDLDVAAKELQIAVDREAGPEGQAARLLREIREK